MTIKSTTQTFMQGVCNLLSCFAWLISSLEKEKNVVLEEYKTTVAICNVSTCVYIKILMFQMKKTVANLFPLGDKNLNRNFLIALIVFLRAQ